MYVIRDDFDNARQFRQTEGVDTTRQNKRGLDNGGGGIGYSNIVGE